MPDGAQSVPDRPSADLVAEIRAQLDLTQEELARELGVSFTTVNAWERGRSEPRRNKRLQLEAMVRELAPTRDGLRVLAIDDDPVSLAVIEGYIAAMGRDIEVSVASDGVTGLLRCGQVEPDLLFLDLLMPDLDGIEVASRVAELGLDVDIVFVTSSSDRALLDRARAAEPRDILQKPLESSRVHELIDAVAIDRGTATP